MPNTVSRTLSTFEGFVVRGNQLGRTSYSKFRYSISMFTIIKR
ncbi:hypothetical protein [Lysinibacillus endophyticus]|nr:hypothetical protein [Lysinibacillus endophyticus]